MDDVLKTFTFSLSRTRPWYSYPSAILPAIVMFLAGSSVGTTPTILWWTVLSLLPSVWYCPISTPASRRMFSMSTSYALKDSRTSAAVKEPMFSSIPAQSLKKSSRMAQTCSIMCMSFLSASSPSRRFTSLL